MIDEKSFKKVSHLIRSEGEHNSRLMFKFPTALEAKLKRLLDENNIKYRFQFLLYRYVRECPKYVEAYYIANFYLPKKKLIINVEPGKRKIEVDSEKLRTFNYEGISLRAQVLNVGEKDFDCPSFAAELLAIAK